MNYYFFNNSLNSKVVGKYPQVEQAIYHCSVWDEPKFIDNVSFKKIDFEPIIANAVLVKKAFVTDLISAGIIGFHMKPLISGRLKNIIQATTTNDLQFHNSPIIYNDVEIKDYWILNPFEFGYQELDFSRTKVYMMEHTFNKVKQLPVSSFRDFINERYNIEKLGYPYSIMIEKLCFLPSTNLDLIALQCVKGGTKYLVSEKLKQRMEYEECTGIEFQPYELSLDEWLKPGGQREKIYGKV